MYNRLVYFLLELLYGPICNLKGSDTRKIVALSSTICKCVFFCSVENTKQSHEWDIGIFRGIIESIP